MDNVTHTIVGVAMSRAMSRAGLDRFGAGTYPTWLLILGANGPDIDVFAGVGAGGARYLEVHRGYTHSFVGAPVVAFIATAIIWLVHRKVGKGRPFPWLLSFWFALAGVLSHLLLDFITPYGTRLLLPFSNARLAWDIFPVVDLWLLPVILTAILLPFLFQLISSEIGARKTSFRPAAIFVLIYLAALGGVRILAHQRAVNLLESFTYRGHDPVRSSAFPESASPFHWDGVVDTGQSLEVVDVRLLETFDPTNSRSYYPPEATPSVTAALSAAQQTRVVRAFLDFAVYPIVYVDTLENGSEVVYRDLRYEHGTLGTHRGAVVRVRLDPNMRVISAQFRFRDPGTVR